MRKTYREFNHKSKSFVESDNGSIDSLKKLQDALEQKIYCPYFISKQTIIQYQDYDASQRLSMKEIIESFHMQKKQMSKLYFKVNVKDKQPESPKVRKGSMKIVSSKNLFSAIAGLAG